MISMLWAWLTGYLVVKLKGANLETLLNQGNQAGIQFWQLERLTSDIIVLKLGVRNFRRLRPLLWKHDIQVRIISKCGLPFSLSQARRRQFLFLGVVLFAFILFHLSGYIWFVQVTQTEGIDQEEIMSVILGEGLRVGLPKSEFAVDSVENALRTNIPEIAWASVEMRGVLVRVKVIERSMPDPETQRAGDIYAKNDGLLTQVVAFRGTPQVAVGETVQAGELLISGEYYDQFGRRQQGRAEGLVLARVWYEAHGEASFQKTVPELTGNTHVNYRLLLGQHTIAIGGKPDFTVSDKDSNLYRGQIRGFTIPIGFARDTYREVFHRTMHIPASEARELAKQRAWENLADYGVPIERVKDFQVIEDEIADQDGIRVTLTVEVETDIGVFESTP